MVFSAPRAYVDWVVPVDTDGNEMGRCVTNGDFDYYISWLADYLYETDIPVPERQQECVDYCRENGGLRRAASVASEGYGLFFDEIDNIQDYAADGGTFEQWRQWEQEGWDELPQDCKDDYEDPEEEYFTDRETFERLGEEGLEARKVPPHIKHVDVPFRAIFAALMKDVPDKEDRMKELHYFYMNFHDNRYK